MFLNSYGQPSLIHPGYSEKMIDAFVKSPLLLCNADSLLGRRLPRNWSGCLYLSEFQQAEEIIKKFQMPPNGQFTYAKLKSNETANVPLSNGDVIRLTAVSLDDNNQHFMYILQDGHVTNIVTDYFTTTAFDVFIRNNVLRKVVADEIDVLFINDHVYKQAPKSMRSCVSELLLRSLVSMLRPRYLRGIWETELPQYIIHECHIEDPLT